MIDYQDITLFKSENIKGSPLTSGWWKTRGN